MTLPFVLSCGIFSLCNQMLQAVQVLNSHTSDMDEVRLEFAHFPWVYSETYGAENVRCSQKGCHHWMLACPCDNVHCPLRIQWDCILSPWLTLAKYGLQPFHHVHVRFDFSSFKFDSTDIIGLILFSISTQTKTDMKSLLMALRVSPGNFGTYHAHCDGLYTVKESLLV